MIEIDWRTLTLTVNSQQRSATVETRLSLADLLPGALRRFGRWVRHRTYVGLGLVVTAVLAGGVGAAVTIEVQRFLGKCSP